MERGAAAPLAAVYAVYSLEDQELEEEESLLHWRTAARIEVHWDEVSMDGEGSEEKPETTEDEDNVEVGGNSGLYYAMTGDVVPLIDNRRCIWASNRVRRAAKAWS